MPRRLKEKKIYLIFGIFIVLICFLFFEIYSQFDRTALEVELESEEVISNKDERNTLIFAVAPVISPERSIEDYQVFAGYLTKTLSRSVRVIQKKTYQEINELIRIGKVDLAIICSGAYENALANKMPLKVVAVPFSRGQSFYHSLFIVRAESPIKTIMDLKGKSIAFSDPLSLTGYFYPLSMVREKGYAVEDFFSNVMFTYSHEGCMNVVLDKIADAASVSDLVYGYGLKHIPNLDKKLRIIHRSPPFGISPVVMNTSIDSLLQKEIRNAFIGMKDSQEGRQILEKMGVDSFGIAPSNLYEQAHLLYNSVGKYLEKKSE